MTSPFICNWIIFSFSPCIFIGRTDVKAQAPILWPSDVKNWLIWKDPDAGQDSRQEEKGMTDYEMVGWHNWLDGHEFEQALGVTVSIVSVCHDMMGPDAMILGFWMLSFSLSSFTFIRKFFSSSLLSVIGVVLSAYLRLLIFLLAILTPACASSSPAFCMMYLSQKLNKQSGDIQPWHTPFPILNQSVVPCPILTLDSWLAYRFLRRQLRWSGISTSWRIFQSLLWSTQSKALV